jgi:serine/threonine protein kinase
MSILNILNIGDTISNWQINKIISNYNNSIILEVVLTSISPDKLINIFDYKTIWIMKIRDDIDEGRIYLNCKLIDCKYALKIPNDSEYFYGNFKLENYKYTWSITEKYDEDIGKNYIFAKNNWTSLLTSVIEFLRFIHQKKIIHGDLKARNILYKSNADIMFKVCDYESLSYPKMDEICNIAGYNGFYYYAIGCNKDESYFSYRMDLEAFGYILWAILLSTKKEEYLFEWQSIAMDLYKKKIKNDSNDMYTKYYIYLDNLKKASYNNLMLNIIEKYFKIISIISWRAFEPPDNSIYDQLIELKNYPI